MIVTAEPYFAVSVPSDVVVMENAVRVDTVGTSEQVTANYELMQRGVYTYDMTKAREPITEFSPKVPLEIYEARNAVSIAQSAGADTLAPDAYQKAMNSLANATNLLAKKANPERSDRGGRAMQCRPRQMRARSPYSARRSRRRRRSKQRRRRPWLRRTRNRKQNPRRGSRLKFRNCQAGAGCRRKPRPLAHRRMWRRAQADAAALASAATSTGRTTSSLDLAQQQAKAAQDAAAKSEAEKQALRAALLDQFNRVLPTTDTPRGLQVNMADVLFAFGKYELQPRPARHWRKFCNRAGASGFASLG